MNRLSFYLARQFAVQAFGLLAVMLGLLFLVECLKFFDVVVVQGQDFWTLVGQAILGMPEIAVVMLGVCMGIGVTRALADLRASQELLVIYVNRQLGSLLSAIVLFAIAGAMLALFISNFVEPWANRRLTDWAASITADIVGRTLVPHRVSEVIPGVTVLIGGRQGVGNITDFFADDHRDPNMRRTYSAKSGKVSSDERGFVLQLNDGSVQYLSGDHDFSEVGFKAYSISLNRLAAQMQNPDDLGEVDSLSIVTRSIASGNWSSDVVARLVQRAADGALAIGVTIFSAALLLVPSGNRRARRLPIELVPLLAALADKTVGAFGSGDSLYFPLIGPALLLGAGLVIAIFRLTVPSLPRPFAGAAA